MSAKLAANWIRCLYHCALSSDELWNRDRCNPWIQDSNSFWLVINLSCCTLMLACQVMCHFVFQENLILMINYLSDSMQNGKQDFSALQFRRCHFHCGQFRRRTISLPNNFGTGAIRFSTKFSLFFMYIILLLFCLKKFLFYFCVNVLHSLNQFRCHKSCLHSPIKFSFYIYRYIILLFYLKNLY